MTKEYVEVIGRQIKSGIIDSFDRKNEDTIDKLHQMVKEISISQEQLTIKVEGKLMDYRDEIKRFKKEFNEKATKHDLKRLESHT